MKVTSEYACEYLRNSVKSGDWIEVSYGRIYIPGEVITNLNGILRLKVCGERINDIATIKLDIIKDMIIEIEHENEEGKCFLRTYDE